MSQAQRSFRRSRLSDRTISFAITVAADLLMVNVTRRGLLGAGAGGLAAASVLRLRVPHSTTGAHPNSTRCWSPTGLRTRRPTYWRKTSAFLPRHSTRFRYTICGFSRERNPDLLRMTRRRSGPEACRRILHILAQWRDTGPKQQERFAAGRGQLDLQGLRDHRGSTGDDQAWPSAEIALAPQRRRMAILDQR